MYTNIPGLSLELIPPLEIYKVNITLKFMHIELQIKYYWS